MSYRTILYVVLVLSLLSIAGMNEIRTSLVVTIGLINITIWVWPRIEKLIKKYRVNTAVGEKHLLVGNYKEAEQALSDALSEAERRNSSAAMRASLLGN